MYFLAVAMIASPEELLDEGEVDLNPPPVSLEPEEVILPRSFPSNSPRRMLRIPLPELLPELLFDDKRLSKDEAEAGLTGNMIVKLNTTRIATMTGNFKCFMLTLLRLDSD